MTDAEKMRLVREDQALARAIDNALAKRPCSAGEIVDAIRRAHLETALDLYRPREIKIGTVRILIEDRVRAGTAEYVGDCAGTKIYQRKAAGK